ncbi:FkbM family methyltransferase [Chloroflexus sp. Y-396-1]|uniref:FkbM family methyltransferase n=1 Tax=Chloroflexus sp. Y-396-1 TaxID=867845 RepID=UPI0018DC9AE2|nr:FkbM family methyltransferase [Chloroflexus sp. Y-396-1]
MIALNIGAHIGVYTLALAQLLPEGHVYAFEPVLKTYQHLQLNVAWNQLRGLVPENITTYRLAFGDVDGETRIFLESSTLQSSLLAQQPLQPYERVPVARLDTWLKQHFIDKVDLIVIDVEGAEDIVLRYATALFQQPRQPLIVCEFNRKFGRQVVIWELLSQFGYRFWRYHSLRNCIEPVSSPYESAIYIHQTHLVHRGYGNVIAAPITWTPPSPPVASLAESHSKR